MLAAGILAATLAYLVKGLSGFANTLVFSSIMSFFSANRNISPLDLVLGLPANLVMTWRERKHIRLRIVLPLVITLFIGMVPGAFFLKFGDETAIKRLLGIAVVLLAVEMFFREKKKTKTAAHPMLLFLIGLVSGILCGLFGIGAFLVAYISRTTENTSALRGNICCVFLAENVLRFILYIPLGLLNVQLFWEAICLFPGMALGLVAGIFLSKRFPERAVRFTVIGLLLVMGVSVIVSNW